jgi:hypothetical protein
MEEELQPKAKQCWFSFHKELQTGWSSGGIKRFIQTHSERKEFPVRLLKNWPLAELGS